MHQMLSVNECYMNIRGLYRDFGRYWPAALFDLDTEIGSTAANKRGWLKLFLKSCLFLVHNWFLGAYYLGSIAKSVS